MAVAGIKLLNQESRAKARRVYALSARSPLQAFCRQNFPEHHPLYFPAHLPGLKRLLFLVAVRRDLVCSYHCLGNDHFLFKRAECLYMLLMYTGWWTLCNLPAKA